jgi:1-deoxy-D-xylulose-5-phosphate reductoisomerase
MSSSGKRRVVLLGSTGSIGTSTLKVAAMLRDRIEIIALAASSSVEKLAAQVRETGVKEVAIYDASKEAALRALLPAGVKVHTGIEGLIHLATLAEADVVLVSIVGTAGLHPALAAIEAGKDLAVASKEILVMAGEVITTAAARHGVSILPVDSEHNAIFQCLPRESALHGGVSKIILTASGGPFRTREPSSLVGVTPEEACKHPNWVMGRKISVDSATMMNKGLEVIEAHWLFNLPGDRIDVLIHPQSVIHSLVSYADGSVLAQLGNPDMRTPIAHALAFPDRVDSGVAQLDLAQIAQLSFEKPDYTRFPCLALAMKALAEGGVASAALNAANEIAVEAFLTRRIGFMAIAQVVDAVLNALPNREASSLADVVDADAAARRAAHAFIDGLPAGARLTERAVQ